MPQKMLGLERLVKAMKPIAGKQYPIYAFFEFGEEPKENLHVVLEPASVGPLLDAIGMHLNRLLPQAVGKEGQIINNECLREINGLFILLFSIHESCSAQGQKVSASCQDLLRRALIDLIPVVSSEAA